MGEVVNLDQYRKQRRTKAGRDSRPLTPPPPGDRPTPADTPRRDDPGAGDGAPGGPDTAAVD